MNEENHDRDALTTPQEVRPVCPTGKVDRPRRPKTTIRRLLVIVLATYAGVCVLINLLQAKLIYYPSKGYDAVPTDIGLAFEDLTLRTADGVNIAAWYIPATDAPGTVIFFHGNAGNMTHRLQSIKVLHRMGLSVLIIDYRGYGRSEGKPSEIGTYEDAEAAWRYLTETRGESPERIALFGRSLGGAIAIELATRHSPAAVATESTFTNLIDIGKIHYRFLPVRLILSYHYDSLSKVSQITCPKLFFHGLEDTLIPLANGRRLFEAAADPKEFIETPGGHNEAGFTYTQEFSERLRDFLLSAFSRE